MSQGWKGWQTMCLLSLVLWGQVWVPPAHAQTTDTEPLWRYDAGATAYEIAISSDGKYVAAEAGDSVYLFSRESPKPLWRYETGRCRVAISSDGKEIAVASNAKNTVYLLDRDAGTPLWAYYIGEREKVGSLATVAISSDGRYVAVGSGFSLYLFRSDNREPLWMHRFSRGQLTSLSMSSDGSYIAVAPADLYLFSRDNGDTAVWHKHIPEPSSFRRVAISADGTVMTASDSDDLVYLFSRERKNDLWSYKTDGLVWQTSISSDGNYIAVASGSEYPGVYLFGSSAGAPLWSYETEDDVYSVALSSDGEYLAAGSIDNGVYFFNRNSAAPLWTYRAGDYVYGVAISSDGRYVAAASLDQKVYLFSRETRVTTPTETSTSAMSQTDVSSRQVSSTYASAYAFDAMTGLILVVAAVVSTLVLALHFRSRRTRRKGLAPGQKYCINCRCELPAAAAFCDACGSKQVTE